MGGRVVNRAVCRCVWSAVALLLLLTSPASAQLKELWTSKIGGWSWQLSISPDGQWVNVGGQLFRVQDDFRELTPAGFAYPCFVGNHLVAGLSEDGLTLYRLPSLRPVLQRGDVPAGWLSASDDGQWIVIGNQGGSPGGQIWQVHPLRLRMTLPGGSPYYVAAKGKYVVHLQTDAQGTVAEVRRTEDWRLMGRVRLVRAGGWGFKVDVSSQGDLLTACNYYAVDVYRVSDGTLLHSFGNMPGFLTQCVLSSTGYLAGLLATYDGYRWKLWRLSDGAEVASQSILDEYDWSVDFTRDGRRLLVLGSRRLTVVDTVTGSLLTEVEAPSDRRFTGFLADSVTIYDRYQRNKLGFFSAQDGHLLHEFTLPRTDLWAMAVSPDGRLLATYPGVPDLEPNVAVYALEADGSLRLLWYTLLNRPEDNEPTLLAFSDDSQWVFVAEYGGIFRVHNAQDGTEDTVFQANFPQHDSPIFSANYACVAIRTGDEVIIVRTSDRTQVGRLRVMGTLVDISGDARRLLTVEDDSVTGLLTCRVYDVQSERVALRIYLPQSSDGRTPQVTLSSDGRFLLVETGMLYHIDTQQVARTRPFGSAAFSPDGRYFYTGARMYEMPADDRALSLRVAIPGWLGPPPEHLRYRLRDIQTGHTVQEGNLWLQSESEVFTPQFVNTLFIPEGTYRLTISGSPFLSASLVFSGGYMPVTVTLFTGDVEGDNEVSLFDFGLLVQAFGSWAGDAHYSLDADLDGDGEVTLWDFGWLIQHFGAIGDE